ncbi:MAG: hypothetical protein ACJ790_02860, partial [Myxococcaceae bacterium]
MSTIRKTQNNGLSALLSSASKTSDVRKTTATKSGRADGFDGANKSAQVDAPKSGNTFEHALMRVLFGAADKFVHGGDAHALALEAMKKFAASPEMMAAFRHAEPAL